MEVLVIDIGNNSVKVLGQRCRTAEVPFRNGLDATADGDAHRGLTLQCSGLENASPTAQASPGDRAHRGPTCATTGSAWSVRERRCGDFNREGLECRLQSSSPDI